MGLPRPLRLTRSDDFARVRAEGQTHRSRLMLINVAANGLAINRFGVVTGKKLGGAVVRNRVRRLLREVLRLSQGRLVTGWDLVLVAHPAAVGQSLTEIQRTFDALASQAGLFRE
ncbi:MAG: ribonuclease P protein component [Chloroflexi bacterium]|nr:ribonuclease P protein component [Chloroflexota bacterium]